jgi:hypothetical protein
MMTREDNSRGSIKKITATRSFELHDQLFEWRDLAFQRITDRSHRLHESSLVYLLKQDLGADSALRAFMQAPSGTPQYPDMSAEDIAVQISIVDNNAKRVHARSSGSSQETLADLRGKAFDSAVESAYETFVPCPISPDLIQFKRQADEALAVDSGTAAHFKQAEADARVAEASIAKAKAEHFGKSIDTKWAELQAKSAGVSQVKFAMEAFELRHGRSTSTSQDRSESSAANLPDHQMLPYRSPEDLRAITWLIQFCIFRTGGFTQEDVQKLMRMNMKPGESPLQAAARVVRYAQILQDAGIPGFDKDYRLWELITNPNRAGGPFFTRALYDRIEVVVNAELKRLNLHREHSAAALRVWITVADERFTAIRGHDLELDRKIQDECQKRSNNQKQKDAKSTPAAAGAKTGQGPNMDPKAGNNWCSLHGYNQTHKSDDCRTLQRQIKAVDTKREELVRMATTIPQEGANLVDKGTRPGAAYNNNRTPVAEGHPAAQKRDDKVNCKVCSDLAGHSVEHRPDSCFMQQGVRVPEWFQPIDARRRDIVNQKRAAQGLPKLPDVKPKSAGKAYVASPLDSTAGVPASEYRVVAMIGRTGLMHAGVFDHVSDPVHLPFPEIPSQLGEGAGAPKPVESRLEFISSTHRFLCRTHHTICELARNPYNGELLSVTCDKCERSWAASEMPDDWSNKNRWTNDPSAMPELFRTPSRAPRGVVRPETVARDLNSSLPTIALERSMASSSASNTTLASLTGRPDLVTLGRTIAPPPLPFPLGGEKPGPITRSAIFGTTAPTEDPYAFASIEDQILFGCILDDFKRTGGSSRLSQVSHILAGTSGDARKFHLFRIETARRTWASRNAAPSPAPATDLASARDGAARSKRLTPLSEQSPSGVSAEPAAADSAPSVSAGIPDPRAGLGPVREVEAPEESVSLGAGLGDQTDVHDVFQYSMSTDPLYNLGGDDTGFEPAHTPEPVRASSRPGWYSAPLAGDLHASWANSMALDFVPRKEFEEEQASTDLISNRVVALEDQVGTLRTAAEANALHTPSLEGEVRLREMDSRLAQVSALTHRAVAELQLSNDPRVTTSQGFIPELISRVRALELKEIDTGTRPAQSPPASYAAAAAAPARPPLPEPVDVRALLSEAEIRLRAAIDLRATTQAVDLLAQNVEVTRETLTQHEQQNKTSHSEHIGRNQKAHDVLSSKRCSLGI